MRFVEYISASNSRYKVSVDTGYDIGKIWQVNIWGLKADTCKSAR